MQEYEFHKCKLEEDFNFRLNKYSDTEPMDHLYCIDRPHEIDL